MNSSFQLFVMVLLSVFILLLFFININGFNYSIPKPNITDPPKVILYWHRMFRRWDYFMGLGTQMFAHCPIKNCVITHNKNHLPSIDQFDAIMFHGVEYDEVVHGKPDKRAPHQRYIFYNWESPFHSNNFMKKTPNFYNWTMTYRRDSDIFHPYGQIEKQTTIAIYQKPNQEEISSRTGKIAWFVSNCNTPSHRDKIAQQISKIIPLDVYGNCGTLHCSRNNDSGCYDLLEKKYKFYLSFENSLCEDYVTEKLFKVLEKNIVPIVYGSANYKKLLPPNSVVDVMSFASVKSLVNHLQFLDANPQEYLRYFEWKRDFVVNSDPTIGVCELCEKLHEGSARKTYNNIYEWWYGKDNSMCSNSFINYFLKQ